MISLEKLKELLEYDANSGALTWRKDHFHMKAGSPAGFLDKSNGYFRVAVCGRRYYSHRLAWFYHNGKWPAVYIDHINGDKTDNRICNLREATKAENSQNMCKRKNNTSGFPGVSWFSRDGKWVAHIRLNGKTKNLGYFSDIQDAFSAYLEAKKKMHPFNPTVRGVSQ